MRGAPAATAIPGANGITLEYPIMRSMTELESVLTYEGTEEVHTLVIGEYLTHPTASRTSPWRAVPSRSSIHWLPG